MDTWEETTGMRRREPEEEPSETPPQMSLRKSLLAEISAAEADANPPSTEAVMAELGRCLRLTAPSGMSQEERKEWLRVALLDVQDMCCAVFFPACAHARKIADHPAKILPAIFAYKPPTYNDAQSAKDRLEHAWARLRNFEAGRLSDQREEPEICTPEQAAEIIEEAGLRPNLSAWRKGRELRMPTEEELAELARTSPTPTK